MDELFSLTINESKDNAIGLGLFDNTEELYKFIILLKNLQIRGKDNAIDLGLFDNTEELYKFIILLKNLRIRGRGCTTVNEERKRVRA